MTEIQQQLLQHQIFFHKWGWSTYDGSLYTCRYCM